ncbi:MipA/OmpV family protein [Gilvimarinus xylanilyticus]|uniref:MipA/OmpV family protein n=1 Tax=Gilvimarinus xylanilyticus TaxID=2944139 RepID=A0A9X2HXK0_9GAMM|nr:MipA/OmpV family protein [Gilvimarinus xylanilyticus]MCP8898869.1 MipA/OmpV family protein [Gilvimarinus xylanilyticus]
MLTLLWALQAAGAEEAYCEQNPDDCMAVGSWQFSVGLGLGVRTNPLYDGDDIPLVLLPEISYYGERFFLDTTSLGFTLVETPAHMLNAVATLGLEQMYFNDLSLGNFVLEGTGGGFNVGGLVSSGSLGNGAENLDMNVPRDETITPNTTDKDGPNEFFHKTMNSPPAPVGDAVTLNDIGKRRMAVLGGLEYAYYRGRTAFSVQLLQDVSGVHKGQEVRAGVDYRLALERNRFTFAGGAVWQSDQFVDYYYGLDESDVGENSSLYYRGEASVTPFVRLDWIRPITPQWTFQATVHNKWLGGGITESPMVDKGTSATVFVGGVYHF